MKEPGGRAREGDIRDTQVDRRTRIMPVGKAPVIGSGAPESGGGVGRKPPKGFRRLKGNRSDLWQDDQTQLSGWYVRAAACWRRVSSADPRVCPSFTFSVRI